LTVEKIYVIELMVILFGIVLAISPAVGLITYWSLAPIVIPAVIVLAAVFWTREGRGLRTVVIRLVALAILLILSISVGLACLKFISQTEYPALVVGSKGMEPVLDVGDIAVVHGKDLREIAVNTTLVFHSPTNYTTLVVRRVTQTINTDGRIYFGTSGGYVGSADYYPQGGVPASNVVGVVISKIPMLGYAVVKLREPAVISIVFLATIVLLAYILKGAPKAKVEHARSERAREYYQLETELRTARRKLTKLTDSHATGSVSSEAYKSLREEYEQKISRLQISMDEVRSKINVEVDSLSVKENAARKELELLEAKKIIGDISEQHYQKTKTKLEGNIREIERRKAELPFKND